MAKTNQNRTTIFLSEAYKVEYLRKNWLIFSWYEKIYSDKLGKDLVIDTDEKYDQIIINGKKYPSAN